MDTCTPHHSAHAFKSCSLQMCFQLITNNFWMKQKILWAMTSLWSNLITNDWKSCFIIISSSVLSVVSCPAQTQNQNINLEMVWLMINMSPVIRMLQCPVSKADYKWLPLQAEKKYLVKLSLIQMISQHQHSTKPFLSIVGNYGY